MDNNVRRLWSSPDLYPIGFDLTRRQISFVQMSRDEYRNYSFLDFRSFRSKETHTVKLDDLLLFDARKASNNGPLCYIFHGAFCCSTLLARYLELIPRCFVVKEPGLLTQIAAHVPGNFCVNINWRNREMEDWNQLFPLCLRLLARTYLQNDVVIIKGHDLCNILGQIILALDSRPKILFLRISLRTFLLSVLKSRSRRDWLRARMSFVTKHAERFSALANVVPSMLTDAEAAAYFWLFNQMLCKHLLVQDALRVLSYDGEQIAETPSDALRVIADFLELRIEGELAGVFGDPLSSRHSKNPSRPYDAESRRKELEAAAQHFAVEVNAGIIWARSICPDLDQE